MHGISLVDRTSDLIAMGENATSFSTFSSQLFSRQLTNNFKESSRLKCFFCVTKQSESEYKRKPAGKTHLPLLETANI